MRKIKKLQANGVYMIMTKCTKRSCFFENASQVRLFKNQFTRHLEGICTVLFEFYKPCGYVYIVKIQSEQSIQSTYLQKRGLSKKAKESTQHSEVWRMISEHFRLAGSTFVSIANRRDNSSGARFKRSYQRYQIENEKELDLLIKLLESEKVLLDQRSIQYQLAGNLKKIIESKISKLRNTSKLIIGIQNHCINVIKNELLAFNQEHCVLKKRYLKVESILTSFDLTST